MYVDSKIVVIETCDGTLYSVYDRDNVQGVSTHIEMKHYKKDDACRFWQTETISNKGILDYINIKIYKTTGRGKFNHMNYRTIDKAIKANGLNGEKREVLKYHYMDVIDLYKILSEAIRGEGIL